MRLVSKSFVDLLFILLCGTIVLLTDSLRVHVLDTAPAQVGAGALSPIAAHDVEPVVVFEQTVAWKGERFASVDPLVAALPADSCLLLIAGDEALSHHRMMRVWSACQQRGLTVKLGAVPLPTPNDTPAAAADTRR